MKIYSGIGPRNTPKDVQEVMTNLATQLSKTGWLLRSGDGLGADRAFQRGAKYQQIFLPFDGFNGSWSNGVNKAVRKIDGDQLFLTKKYYMMGNWDKRDWDKLNSATQAILARNVPIILGEYLDDPSKMVITWRPEGHNGGTGMACNIAEDHQVPIFNILYEKDQKALCEFVERIEYAKG